MELNVRIFFAELMSLEIQFLRLCCPWLAIGKFVSHFSEIVENNSCW